MNLIRTSLLNGIAVIVRMLALLGINKVMAIYVGPVGYAIVGQFYNTVQMITTFASGAINIGVVKYTAENVENQELQHRIWKTAGTIAISSSFLVSIIIAILNKELAQFFLKDRNLGGVFLWFSFGLVFFVLNALLLAILNGKKEISKFVSANIFGSILSLVLVFWLAYRYQLYGSLVALGIYQSITCFVTLLLCLRSSWFKLSYVWGSIEWEIVKKLAHYTLMALTTAVCVPASHMLIRNYLGKEISWMAAGYWEAIWKFSSAYLLVITSTLSVYYLPRISELKTADEVRSEIWKCMKLMAPVSILMSIGLYFCRDIVIRILFTNEFLVIRELFFWQLIGDTIKILSWILSFVFLAKGLTKYYVISEVIFTFLFFGLIVILKPYFQLEATVIAHAINYTGYLLFVYWILKKQGYVK